VSAGRVAIVGPGAIGSLFAAALQDAGRPAAVLCGRTRRPAGAVQGPDGQVTALAAPLVTSYPEAGERADWILLAVKAHQTADAAGWLRQLAGAGSRVLVLQNGVDHRERVAPLAGQAAVVPGVLWSPVQPAGDGLVRQLRPARLMVARDADGDAVAKLLAGGRVQVELTDDLVTVAWHKLTMNAVSALSALTARGAGIFRDEAVAVLARRLAAECVAVGRAEGADLPDRLADDVVARLGGRSAGAGSSILTDRIAGRRLEWEARNGVIQRLGARHGIATPVSDVIVPLLAACGPVTG
jgi:2-dehydropantoate 2-reductase